MKITYRDDRKDLPIEMLFRLFLQAGWTQEDVPEELYRNFNRPFVHSTLVVSAWNGERLVGCVRALSDTVVRAILYDLVVDEEYRHRGIGSELVRRCMAKYPKAEWLLQTEEHIIPFYEGLGFARFDDPVLYRQMSYAGGNGES